MSIEAIKKYFKKISCYQSVETFFSWLNVITVVIFFELILSTWMILTYLYQKNLLEHFLSLMNISTIIAFVYSENRSVTSCCNISQDLSNTLGFSLDNFTLLIGLLTGFIFYTYFFVLLMEDPDKSMGNQTRKKMVSFFVYLVWIAMIFTVMLVLLIITGYIKSISQNEWLLIGVGWLNFILLMPVAKRFDDFFENYNNLDQFVLLIKDTVKADNSIEKKKIELEKFGVCSIFIFFLSLEFAFAAVFFGFNILVTIFAISSILLIHAWINRVFHLPKEKNSIQLSSGILVNDVFIIHELSTDYIEILLNDNQKRKISVANINQIFINRPTEMSPPPANNSSDFNSLP